MAFSLFLNSCFIEEIHVAISSDEHGGRLSSKASQGMVHHARIQRGDRGSGPPPPTEKYKNIGFHSNTGSDPLKITNLQSQHSMLGHHRLVRETPWRFAGRPMMVRSYWYFVLGLLHIINFGTLLHHKQLLEPRIPNCDCYQ